MSVPRIVVVGDAGIDVVARHSDPIAYGGDARAQVRLTGGGSGANTALWLRAASTGPVLLCRVGDDATARLVRAELEASGVECAFAVDPEVPTCCVVVLVDREGQRSMLPDRGANARFCPEDVHTAVSDGLLAGAAHLHLSGYVLLDESSRPAGLAALAAARAAGLTTSVDPQSAPLITDPKRFMDDVRGVDLLLPNTPELHALTGSEQPDSAKALLDDVGAVVVTQGAEGAAWVDGAGVRTRSARAAVCVDSTGAGDAFDAGLIAAWVRGEGPEAALLAGVEFGTHATELVGAQPARSGS